jgi:hypothetical protein
MYARVMTMRSRSGGELSQRFADSVTRSLPAALEQPGCVGGLVLGDPLSGELQTITFWAGSEPLVESKPVATVIAAAVADSIDADLVETTTQVYDVVALDVERLSPHRA